MNDIYFELFYVVFMKIILIIKLFTSTQKHSWYDYHMLSKIDQFHRTPIYVL
jgi:hypothetical protein